MHKNQANCDSRMIDYTQIPQLFQISGGAITKFSSTEEWRAASTHSEETQFRDDFWNSRLKLRACQQMHIFRRVHKIEKSDYWLRHVLLSVLPSVCPHETTQFPPDGFSWILIFQHISKMCREN